MRTRAKTVPNTTRAEFPLPIRRQTSKLKRLAFKTLPKISEEVWLLSGGLTLLINSERLYVHHLIFNKRLAQIQELVQSEPSNLAHILNFQDQWGNTPVMLATKLAPQSVFYLDIIETLVKAGANLRTPNWQGVTPLDDAVRQKNKTLVTLLVTLLIKKNYWATISREITSRLQKMPDFRLELKWDVGIGVFRKLRPSEKYVFSKQGNTFRIDCGSNKQRKSIGFYFERNLFMKKSHENKYIDLCELFSIEKKHELASLIMNNPSPLQKPKYCEAKLAFKKGPKLIGEWQSNKFKLRCLRNTPKKLPFSSFEGAYHSFLAPRCPKPVYSSEESVQISPDSNSFDAVTKPKTLSVWLSSEVPLDFSLFAPIISVLIPFFPKLQHLLCLSEVIPPGAFPTRLRFPMNFGLKGQIQVVSFEHIFQSSFQPLEVSVDALLVDPRSFISSNL